MKNKRGHFKIACVFFLEHSFAKFTHVAKCLLSVGKCFAKPVSVLLFSAITDKKDVGLSVLPPKELI